MTDKFPNQEQGNRAVELVEKRFNVDRESTDWYDAVNPRTGTKFEVKSTQREYKNGRPGRFRLWREQHKSLVSADARGTAWYVFVLFDGGKVAGIARHKPKTIGRLIDHWNLAGHREKVGRQYKLPWDEIF